MNQRDPVSRARQPKPQSAPVSTARPSHAPDAVKAMLTARGTHKSMLSPGVMTPHSCTPARARHAMPRAPLPRGIATPIEPRITVRTASVPPPPVAPKPLERLAYHLQRHGWTIVRVAVGVVGVLAFLASVKAIRQLVRGAEGSNAASARIAPQAAVPPNVPQPARGLGTGDEAELEDGSEDADEGGELDEADEVDEAVAPGAALFEQAPSPDGLRNQPAPESRQGPTSTMSGPPASGAQPRRGAMGTRARQTAAGWNAAHRAGAGAADETANAEPFKRTF